MAENRMRYIAMRQAGEGQAAEKKENVGPAGGKGRADREEEIWIRKEYLLFDLDGTLTDPKLGITSCVQYALREFGIEEPDLDKLEPFIGPPLADSFKMFYGFTEEQAEKAVAKYRERFQDKGIFENEIYAGIPQMLKKLKLRKIHLGVASSKPTVFVEKILEHFQIRQYFDVVVGSELDGSRSKKEEVILEALHQFFPNGNIQRQKIFMIGDRKYDTEGAKAVGVESVGVTFGYGGMEELMEAHTDYIVRSVEELRRFLLRGYEDMEKDLTQMQKSWILIYHLILFIAVKGFVQSIGGDLLRARGVTELSGNAKTLLLGLGFVCAGAAIFKSACRTVKRTIRDMYLTHLKWEPRIAYVQLAAAAIGLSQGVAMLLELTGFTKTSNTFQAVLENQASDALWVALLVYGIVGPVSEELLFRGVIYGYVRRFFDVKTAIVGSAILFGIYHGNLVQAVYAVLMGYFIAYGYEYFAQFRVPLLLHVGMNLLTLIVGYTGLGATAFVCWPVCIALLLLGVIALFLLSKRKHLT